MSRNREKRCPFLWAAKTQACVYFVGNRVWLELSPTYPSARHLYSTPPTPTTFHSSPFNTVTRLSGGHPDWGRPCHLRGEAAERRRKGTCSCVHFCALTLQHALCCAHNVSLLKRTPSCSNSMPRERTESDSTYLQECPEFPNPSGDLGICVAVQSRWDRRKRCYGDKKRTDDGKSVPTPSD